MSFFSGAALLHQLELANARGVVLNECAYDESTNGLVLRTTQDVEPLLQRNKELYQDDSRGYSASKEWQWVASIPTVIAQKWRDEEGIDVLKAEHWPKVRAKLNDSENQFLRTAPGRL